MNSRVSRGQPSQSHCCINSKEARAHTCLKMPFGEKACVAFKCFFTFCDGGSIFEKKKEKKELSNQCSCFSAIASECEIIGNKQD